MASQTLKQCKFSEINTQVAESNASSEVEAVSEIISLLDPLTMSRIATPCRSIKCNHYLQAFDMTSFLEINQSFGNFKCPCCSTVLVIFFCYNFKLVEDIRFCEFFASVIADPLVALDEEVTRVEVIFC
jgi:SUMO ligase MMS21 Smc5/6 complex component